MILCSFFFVGMDVRRRCSWCYYMVCILIDLWKCYGNCNIVCDNFVLFSYIWIDCLGKYFKLKVYVGNGISDMWENFISCIRSCMWIIVIFIFVDDKVFLFGWRFFFELLCKYSFFNVLLYLLDCWLIKRMKG